MVERTWLTHRWLRLAVFGLVANPVTLIGACAVSFGIADTGNALIEGESTVLYEKWTYRLREPEPGDTVVSTHHEYQVSMVGTVRSSQAGTLEVDARFLPPGASVSHTETVTVQSDDVEARVIGSFGGTGDEDLASILILVTPWVLGFVMLAVAVAWAERISRKYEGSNRWWPVPTLLWGLGTLIYAWRMERRR